MALYFADDLVLSTHRLDPTAIALKDDKKGWVFGLGAVGRIFYSLPPSSLPKSQVPCLQYPCSPVKRSLGDEY